VWAGLLSYNQYRHKLIAATVAGAKAGLVPRPRLGQADDELAGPSASHQLARPIPMVPADEAGILERKWRAATPSW